MSFLMFLIRIRDRRIWLCTRTSLGSARQDLHASQRLLPVVFADSTLFERIFEGDWRNIYDVDQKARKSPASREQDDQKFSRAVVRTAAERARGIPKDGGSGTKLCLVHS